jgi:hypothetical protein
MKQRWVTWPGKSASRGLEGELDVSLLLLCSNGKEADGSHKQMFEKLVFIILPDRVICDG